MKLAKLNNNNIVIDLITVNDDIILDLNNIPNESLAISYLNKITGHSNWKKSDDSHISKIAVINGFYDSNTNTFKPQRPFDSWIFNEEKWNWNPPTN
jgi:hypothetical protein